MKADLTLVSMEEMTEEIEKRFDTVVLLTRRQITDDDDNIVCHFKDKTGSLGLMKIAESGILNNFKSTGVVE